MKRKLFALLCVCSLMGTMVCGCGKTENPTVKSSEVSENSSEKSTEVVSSEVEEPKLDYVELDWYNYDAKVQDLDIIQAALDEYFLEKLNCKVNLHMLTWSEFKEKVPTMLMAGENVDLVRINNGLTTYHTSAEQGMLYPLDELMDKYGKGVKGLFNDQVWESLQIDEHVYMVPTLKDNATITGYIYNSKLAEELGLDMENLDWSNYMDIEEFCLKALALRDEKYPEYKGMPLLSRMSANSPYFASLEKSFGANYLAVANIPGAEANPEYGTDTLYNWYESDAYREQLLLIQRLVEAGVFAYDYTIYEGNAQYEPSTLINPAWGYTWIGDDLFGGEGYPDTLVVFEDNVWADTNSFAGIGMAIGANCKDPERAMMVMELLNTDPYVASLLRFGVEGEHWEYDKDNNIVLANRNADVSNAGWLLWYGIGFGNITIVDGPESYVGPDRIVMTKMAEYNNEAILATHMGFVVDTTNIINEIAACNNVVAEYSYLENGQVESAEAVNKALDEMIAKLKANGSDKIVEEIQRQVNEWKAGK